MFLTTDDEQLLFLAIFSGLGWFWVDAHDPEGDGIYTESRTRSLLSYNNWSPWEPNFLNSEKCAYVATHSTKWNNNRCSNTVPILCEYDLIWFNCKYIYVI